MVSKSRCTASSSTPVAEPTVSTPGDDELVSDELLTDTGLGCACLSFTPASVVNDGLTLFTSVFARTTRTGGTVDAATAAGAGLTRALDEIVDAAAGARVIRVLCETVEAVDTDAAAEDETCEEARALGGPVEAADTDVAAAEEEACGEVRALGGPVETAGTAVEEETFGEARTQGEAAVTDPET